MKAKSNANASAAAKEAEEKQKAEAAAVKAKSNANAAAAAAKEAEVKETAAKKAETAAKAKSNANAAVAARAQAKSNAAAKVKAEAEKTTQTKFKTAKLPLTEFFSTFKNDFGQALLSRDARKKFTIVTNKNSKQKAAEILKTESFSKYANTINWSKVNFNKYNFTNAQKNMIRRLNIASSSLPSGVNRPTVNISPTELKNMNRNTAIQQYKQQALNNKKYQKRISNKK